MVKVTECVSLCENVLLMYSVQKFKSRIKISIEFKNVFHKLSFEVILTVSKFCILLFVSLKVPETSSRIRSSGTLSQKYFFLHFLFEIFTQIFAHPPGSEIYILYVTQ